MPSPGPGGSQSSLAGMVGSWLTSQFRTGRSSRKLAMRLDGKREPDYHVERADAAAAWRRHFQTAAFLLERGIVPANLTPSLSGNVRSVPSSFHDQPIARSATIEPRLFCCTCWSNITRLLKTP